MIGQFKRSGQHLIDRAAVVISTEIEARLVGRANVNFVRQLAGQLWVHWTKNEENQAQRWIDRGKEMLFVISHTKMISIERTRDYFFQG